MSFLGKLSLDAIPYHEPIIMVTLAVVAVIGLYVAALITKHKKWGVLWHDWLTSVDHKRLGIMYIVLAFIMLVNPRFLRRHHDAYPTGTGHQWRRRLSAA